MFACLNMFWARHRVILARAARWGLKWTQNIFILKNINSITIIITLEGIALRKYKTEKNDNETVWTINQAKLARIYKILPFEFSKVVRASRFWLPAYIVRIFDSHFLLVYFSGLKYILARQILHFSPQNAPQCSTKW